MLTVVEDVKLAREMNNEKITGSSTMKQKLN